MRRWIRSLMVATWVVGSCAARGQAVADGAVADEERLQAFYADLVLDALDGRDWLLTDGFIDVALTRRAAERGLSVTLVPMVVRKGDAGNWRKAVATLGSEPLDVAVELGPIVFLREWLRSAPQDVAKRVATMAIPDLWSSAGMVALPNGPLFLGSADAVAAAANLDQRLARHREIWDAVGEQLVGVATSSPKLAETRSRLRRQCGLVANNLGVLLQRADRAGEAFEAFTRARLLDPQNVSALLNRAVCVKRGVRPELAEQIAKELEGLRENTPDPRTLWALTQLYGVVEHPEDFVALGWAWALSGVPAAEKPRWEAALEKVDAAQRDAVRRQLEAVHAGQTGGTDGDLRVLEALRDEKRRGEAYIVLARRAVGQGQFDAAEAWLAKASAAGVPTTALAAEKASLLTAQGKAPEARALLEAAVAEQPDAWQLWALLTTLLAELKDADALAAAVRKLEALPNVEAYHVLVAKGRLHALQGQAWPARDAFQRALVEKPSAVLLYDLILPLDFALADKRAGEQHADALLQNVPTHAFANYVKGALLLERKDYAAAENYFRRSLASAVTLHALNDFAVLLLETRRPEEAERTARAALELDSDASAAWDTLAAALTALERHDEAHAALEKAIAAGGSDDPRILLHWAQSSHRRGDSAVAKEAADKVHDVRAKLSPMERDALLKLRDALQRGK